MNKKFTFFLMLFFLLGIGSFTPDYSLHAKIKFFKKKSKKTSAEKAAKKQLKKEKAAQKKAAKKAKKEKKTQTTTEAEKTTSTWQAAKPSEEAKKKRKSFLGKFRKKKKEKKAETIATSEKTKTEEVIPTTKKKGSFLATSYRKKTEKETTPKTTTWKKAEPTKKGEKKALIGKKWKKAKPTKKEKTSDIKIGKQKEKVTKKTKKKKTKWQKTKKKLKKGFGKFKKFGAFAASQALQNPAVQGGIVDLTMKAAESAGVNVDRSTVENAVGKASQYAVFRLNQASGALSIASLIDDISEQAGISDEDKEKIKEEASDDIEDLVSEEAENIEEEEEVAEEEGGEEEEISAGEEGVEKISTNFYELLGILPNAKNEEINKSYKQLILKVHPDKVDSTDKDYATEITKWLNEAKEVLMGDDRSYYDESDGIIEIDKGAWEFLQKIKSQREEITTKEKTPKVKKAVQVAQKPEVKEVQEYAPEESLEEIIEEEPVIKKVTAPIKETKIVTVPKRATKKVETVVPRKFFKKVEKREAVEEEIPEEEEVGYIAEEEVSEEVEAGEEDEGYEEPRSNLEIAESFEREISDPDKINRNPKKFTEDLKTFVYLTGGKPAEDATSEQKEVYEKLKNILDILSDKAKYSGLDMNTINSLKTIINAEIPFSEQITRMNTRLAQGSIIKIDPEYYDIFMNWFDRITDKPSKLSARDKNKIKKQLLPRFRRDYPEMVEFIQTELGNSSLQAN